MLIYYLLCFVIERREQDTWTILVSNHFIKEHEALICQKLVILSKALSQMWLDSFRVLGLCEDLQEFIITQEKKTGKSEALSLQVVIKALLDAV